MPSAKNWIETRAEAAREDMNRPAVVVVSRIGEVLIVQRQRRVLGELNA